MCMCTHRSNKLIQNSPLPILNINDRKPKMTQLHWLVNDWASSDSVFSIPRRHYAVLQFIIVIYILLYPQISEKSGTER